MIDSVLITAMRGGIDASRLLAKKKQLAFSVRRLNNDFRELCDGLVLLVDYAEHRRKMPESIETLREFARIMPGNLAATEETRERYKKSSADYRSALTTLNKLLNDPTNKPSTDWDLVTAALLDDARRRLYAGIYATAISIVNGTASSPSKSEPAPSGIAAARRYAQKMLTLDVCADTSPLEGDFHENLDLMRLSMLATLEHPNEFRCLTGYNEIDKKVVIGTDQEIRFVLIAGFSNHGKSSLLFSWIYNLARQGKRILLVPKECSPMEAWRKLAWLHADSRPDLKLPSLNDWKTRPDLVTDTHITAFEALCEDLKSGTTMPGRIEVVHASTWPEILDKVNSSIVPYDVLAIDYIAHLKYEGKDKREGISNIFRDAQALSHTYRDNRGLVVISPVQTNKAGMKAAEDAADEGEYDWGVYDLSAVDTFTDAVRDADLVINVWHKGYLTPLNQTKISCMKSRNLFFDNFMVTADPRTRYYRDAKVPVCAAG